MVWEMEEDALVQPSDLGLLFRFPLFWRKGEVGDRIVDAFLEEWYQDFLLVAAV